MHARLRSDAVTILGCSRGAQVDTIRPTDAATATCVDQALDKKLATHFLAGLPISAARNLYYGVRWRFVFRDFQLPLAHASLTGFVRRLQDTMRDPETWEATLLTALALLRFPLAINPNVGAEAAAAARELPKLSAAQKMEAPLAPPQALPATLTLKAELFICSKYPSFY